VSTTPLELDRVDLEELLLVMSRDPRPVAAELRDALLRAHRGLEDQPASTRVTVELDPAERRVLLEDMRADHPLRPRVFGPAVDEVKRARAGRDRNDAVARHFAQRAAMEDLDRAVRRALELGLAADVRRLVDDALADAQRADV
jgi:hypothetical protein